MFNLSNKISTLSFKKLSQILSQTLSQTYPKNYPKKLSQQFRTLSWSLFNNFLVPQLYRTISLKISRQNFYESQNFPEIFPENCPWHNICKIFMQSPEKQYTGDPCLMRISLLQISLVRFFKTFHKYLAYAFFGLFISLVRIFGKK